MAKLVQFTILLAVAVAVSARSYGQQAPLREETVSSYAQPAPVIVREVIKAEPILVPGPAGPMGLMGPQGEKGDQGLNGFNGATGPAARLHRPQA